MAYFRLLRRRRYHAGQDCTRRGQVRGRRQLPSIAKTRSAIDNVRHEYGSIFLRPLVGISACLKENGRGGWHHTVGDKYVQAAIHAVGGLPILIPAIGPEFGEDDQAMTEALDRLLDTLDGVLLTGSPSNVEPHHYEGEQSRPGTAHDPARDATTLPLIRHSIDRGVPLFAICRGLQEVNVALGGTLHQLVHEVDGPARPPLAQVARHRRQLRAGARHRDRRGRPAASPAGRAPRAGELAARPGRRSPGAARPARGGRRRRPGRGLQRARCAGLRAGAAMASRAPGAREPRVDETVRRLRRRLPRARRARGSALPLRAAAE